MAALLTDYRNGSSLRDLQRSYALGRGSVQWLLREAGVRRRRGSLTHSRSLRLSSGTSMGSRSGDRKAAASPDDSSGCARPKKRRQNGRRHGETRLSLSLMPATALFHST